MGSLHAANYDEGIIEDFYFNVPFYFADPKKDAPLTAIVSTVKEKKITIYTALLQQLYKLPNDDLMKIWGPSVTTWLTSIGRFSLETILMTILISLVTRRTLHCLMFTYMNFVANFIAAFLKTRLVHLRYAPV